jgi:hypothetical protein
MSIPRSSQNAASASCLWRQILSLIIFKKEKIMAQNQVDLTPGTAGNTTGLHVHTPAGHSASEFNHPTDFPTVTAGANPPAGGKAISVKIQGTQGQTVRFSNPS